MRIGRGDADVSDAVLLAVPGEAIAGALDGLRGIERKTVLDPTNLPTPTLPRSTSGSARRAPRRTTCGAATRRRGRSSSN